MFCDCCCVFEWDGSFPFVAFSGHDRRPRLKRSEREGGTEGRKEGRKEVCTLDAATMAFRGSDDASETENVNCYSLP